MYFAEMIFFEQLFFPFQFTLPGNTVFDKVEAKDDDYEHPNNFVVYSVAEGPYSVFTIHFVFL